MVVRCRCWRVFLDTNWAGNFNLGYLLNSGEAVLKVGITRCVNRLEVNVPQENVPQRRGGAENQTSPSPRLSASAGDSAS